MRLRTTEKGSAQLLGAFAMSSYWRSAPRVSTARSGVLPSGLVLLRQRGSWQSLLALYLGPKTTRSMQPKDALVIGSQREVIPAPQRSQLASRQFAGS